MALPEVSSIDESPDRVNTVTPFVVLDVRLSGPSVARQSDFGRCAWGVAGDAWRLTDCSA